MQKFLPLLMMPVVAGCAGMTPSTGKTVSEVISADLARADGSWAGVATISRRSDGVFLSIEGQSAQPGTFGMHLHAVGKCEAPDFASAGGHWNPEMKQHGHDNPLGAHGGDLPNIVAGADNKLKLELKMQDIKLEGDGGFLDNDGGSIIIHEKADDNKTDPSGNSGKRIICGVFKSGNRI